MRFETRQGGALYHAWTRSILHGFAHEIVPGQQQPLWPAEELLSASKQRLGGEATQLLRDGCIYSHVHRIPFEPSVTSVAASTQLCDSGKLLMLDRLLSKLHAGGHRVLIFSQMRRMIDILEAFLRFRRYNHLRLDGPNAAQVADSGKHNNTFAFLLSTRSHALGHALGINLTVADTVIFYDSDWNPKVDAQAMDQTHRMGQMKQVTVYRLVVQSTIEEHLCKRMCVPEPGSFHSCADSKPHTFEPSDVMSLLLDEHTEGWPLGKAEPLLQKLQRSLPVEVAHASIHDPKNGFPTKRALKEIATGLTEVPRKWPKLDEN